MIRSLLRRYAESEIFLGNFSVYFSVTNSFFIKSQPVWNPEAKKTREIFLKNLDLQRVQTKLGILLHTATGRHYELTKSVSSHHKEKSFEKRRKSENGQIQFNL